MLDKIENDCVRLIHTISGEGTEFPRDGIVLVTDRISNDSMYYELKPALETGKLQSLRVIGDAEAPNIIAQAVFSGHLAARELDEEKVEGTPFKVVRMMKNRMPSLKVCMKESKELQKHWKQLKK